MKMPSFLFLRVVQGVLATTVVLLAMGCSGGWGDLKPAIARQQGLAQTVVAGHSATFSITATGTGPFGYQWYLNGVAITGATSSSYTIASAASDESGAVYTVAVTNAGGTTMSAPYVLTVNTPPTITTQPAARTVLVGQTATFTAAASGTAPLTYQWYQGSAPIAGATAASYTTPATTSIGSSAYGVMVTNVAGYASSATAALTAMPITPTLNLATIPTQIYGSPAFTVAATSASSGAVSYTVASGPASISGNTVTLTGAGTVVLNATQAASGNYAAATASISFSVAVATPSLVFSSVANQIYGSPAFTVAATSASSGTVSYTVASGPASISGNTVTLTGAGTVVLNATQAASGNYAAATASTSFSVAAATPSLVFSSANQIYGSPAFTVAATSASSGTVSYTVASGPASISGNTVTLTGAGTVVLNATQAASGNYAAATASTSFSVAAATPSLVFSSVANQIYGSPAFAVAATSASSGTVSYTVASGPASISGNTVTLTGAGTVVLNATQAASGNYAAATASTSFSVAAATPSLVFSSVANQIYGSPAFTVAATSASSGTVSYTVASGPASISGNTVTLTGAGTVVLNATQAASGNYAAATASTSFSVAAATPSLVFSSVANQIYGSPAFAVSATSASSGTVSYTVASGPASISGNTVTLTGAGTVVLNATQAASGNYAAATASTSFSVAAATPSLVFSSVANQIYGSPAFAVAATSASSGAVSYTVASGPASISGNTVTLTGAGTVVLNATQAASGNYAAATASTSFSVAAATPSLVFSSVANQIYGSPAFAVAATSASSGAVSYTVASGPASISGNTVTLTGAGTVVLNATQAASGNYAAATASTSFLVANSTPVASSLAGSSATPAYGTSIHLVPTFSGGTAVLGTAGPGSSDLAGSVLSGGSYPSAAVTVTTTYTLTVTGSGGNSVSTSFVATPGTVTLSPVTPANQTITPGNQNFSATASGGGTNAVIWSANQGSITSGGVWTTPDVAGTYTITATSADEPSISATTTVTVSKPVITQQPASKNTCSGYTPSLTTAANYATSYQWYFNGNTVGVGSPILTLANVTSASNGTYSCAAINAAGLVSSNAVTLNVVSPTTLTITKQPASVSVYTTQTATFSVAATGTGVLAYQWYTGTPGSGALINGATSSTYTTPALASASNGVTYYVTVTDPDCTGTTATSSAAILSVSSADTTVPPSIVVQPVGQSADVNSTSTVFSVTASGSGTLTYQWYRVPYSSTELSSPTAGAAIAGANQSTYTLPASSTQQSNDGDTYYVVVTNAYGSAMSSRGVLGVGPGIVLQIDAEPQTQYVAVGTLASFSVTATCTGCIPDYRWFWYAPNSTTATALSDGAVSTGPLSGAIVSGVNTSSLTMQDLPASATGAIFYAVVTSTSDGTSPIAGTNPLTSSTAGLFVNTLGTVGSATAGGGLCNNGTSGKNWVLNGNNPGTSNGDVPYQNTTACTMELTNDQGTEHSAVYWPTLISTANFSISFTVAISATNGTPADGFTMVLADPSQGATTASIGATGEGLGADGIPGFVVGFDTYQNGNKQQDPGCGSCDPVPVPYMAVGQGAASLWENPWTFVNGNLDTQHSADYTPQQFTNATHSYVVSVVNKIMTVTMDGNELFTGTVSLPPAAYLGFTASTGGSMESVTFSNLTATVSAP